MVLRRVRSLVIVAIGFTLVGASMSPAQPAAPAPAAVAPVVETTGERSFAGVWETTFGTMTLTQTGDAVTGEYSLGAATATIDGKVKDGRLTFTYVEPRARGEGWFELAEDGRSFTGKWRQAGDEQWRDWRGTLSTLFTFDGLWNTTYGAMRLCVRDSACQGVYAFAGVSRIAGTIKDKRFEFSYEQPHGERGEGWYELADDGMSFSGEWKSANMEAPRKWTGTRVRPQRGVVWLVVLEAHWEGSLKDREYSYGEMQRAFFNRLPMVNFRHRFVHDLADVQEFCGELVFIAEPVILYFSCHGTAEGIRVGNGIVTPEQIASALHAAANIKLLHFGACEVMKGDAPKRLLEALPDGVEFPISGFANTADWAGSAIIDFTYLDLIIEYGLTPAAAVQETRRSLRFADRRSDGGVIPGSMLRIYEKPTSR